METDRKNKKSTPSIGSKLTEYKFEIFSSSSRHVNISESANKLTVCFHPSTNKLESKSFAAAASKFSHNWAAEFDVNKRIMLRAH